MSERFSCIGMDLPRWIPKTEECVWCNRHTQEPTEIEITKEDFRVHYRCSNEKCEHKRRNKTKAPFGLIFDSPKFTEHYIAFIEEEKKRPAKTGDETNEE